MSQGLVCTHLVSLGQVWLDQAVLTPGSYSILSTHIST